MALEPEGATTCVLQPRQNRVCVYRRTASEIVADECYAFTVATAIAWQPWLVASGYTGERIRLVDATGRMRFTIVPAGRPLGPGVAQMPIASFAALASKVTPWRTLWLTAFADTSAGQVDRAAEIQAALEHWRQAWEQRRLDDYFGCYGPSFIPRPNHGVEQWRARKRYLFEHSGDISVQLTDVSVFILDGGASAITTFQQTYRSAPSASQAHKLLRWQRDGDGWAIATETVLHETPHLR